MKDMIGIHSSGFERRKEWKELFDLEFWKKQESYKLIKEYCNPEDSIFEIGCLTGHHLILLAQEGYRHLKGIDFVKEAIDWAELNSVQLNIDWEVGTLKYNTKHEFFNKIILFDELEHQRNIDGFIDNVLSYCHDNSEILFLVPKGREFFDECHINFYPDCECLQNLLEQYFNVVEIKEVDNNKKIFARCKI